MILQGGKEHSLPEGNLIRFHFDRVSDTNRLFRKVMPLDILPSFLFKALEAGDLERSEKLGAFELDEEDVALCTLVDLGKNDYGASLRALLDKAMKEEE